MTDPIQDQLPEPEQLADATPAPPDLAQQTVNAACRLVDTIRQPANCYRHDKDIADRLDDLGAAVDRLRDQQPQRIADAVDQDDEFVLAGRDMTSVDARLYAAQIAALGCATVWVALLDTFGPDSDHSTAARANLDAAIDRVDRVYAELQQARGDKPSNPEEAAA